MNKQEVFVWILIVLGIGAIILGMVGVVTQKKQLGSLLNPVGESDWIRGNKDAKAVFVEYSDFECPACAAYYGLLKNLESEFPNDVAFVFRHFPLEGIHKQSRLAAQAAEAAGIQGKFWEMHDMLFEKQQEWSVSENALNNFISFAQNLELDVEKFKTDIASKDIDERVQSDLIMGNEQQILGTPTFFLNGKQIKNPESYEEFKLLINQEINK